MNRAKFYAALRKRSSGVFGTRLSETQVAFLEALLEQGSELSNVELACVMGNVYHECHMVPKRESMSYSARRMTEVWPSRFRTIASAQPYARNPRKLANKVYGGRMGNHLPDDGWRFRGGPGPQLTGRANYEKFGLEEMTEAQLVDPEINARIALEGMTQGKFTGKKLSDYLRDGRYDFKGARATVNADVRRVGAEVAGNCRAFLLALQESGRKPSPRHKRPARPQTPQKPDRPPVKRSGGLAAFLRAIFGGKAS